MTATRTESVTPRPSGGHGGRPVRFVQESVSELRKVTWPARKETQTAVVVVVITTVVVALILGTFDYIWAGLTSIVYHT